jgi:superfamily II DNA or RNA helicase
VLTLKATNTYTYVGYNSADRTAQQIYYNALRDMLSYEVPSAEWSSKYKTGQWDGRLSLYNGREKYFPSGLTDHVIKKLTEKGIEFEWTDERPFPWKNAKFSADYGDRELRYYQTEGPDEILKYSRGILAHGTGSGKTLTLCEMLCKLQCKPVCIIVPSITLLKQTATELEQTLKEQGENIKVGKIGGGFWDVVSNGINISTYHSALSAFNTKFLESKNSLVYDEFAGDKIRKSIPQLESELKSARKSKNLKLVKKIESQIINKKNSLSNKEDLQKLIATCQVFVVDECHIAAEIIEFISLKAVNAYYKAGLSATPWREDNQEIRIEGALGGILKHVSSSELIQHGYLCKPTILMFKLNSNARCSGYQECYTKNIIENDYRNNLIKRWALECFNSNIPTVILVERIIHGQALQDLIPGSLFVPGKEKGEEDPSDEEQDYRRRMLNKLGNNEHILIATQWLYTGIDCPPMQCLILAGSASSSVTTYQQVGRVLRLSPETNKNFALIIDFYDENRYLKSHGAKRKRTYKLEEEYEVKVIK